MVWCIVQYRTHVWKGHLGKRKSNVHPGHQVAYELWPRLEAGQLILPGGSPDLETTETPRIWLEAQQV